jgi:hypothetical protein
MPGALKCRERTSPVTSSTNFCSSAQAALLHEVAISVSKIDESTIHMSKVCVNFVMMLSKAWHHSSLGSPLVLKLANRAREQTRPRTRVLIVAKILKEDAEGKFQKATRREGPYPSLCPVSLSAAGGNSTAVVTGGRRLLGLHDPEYSDSDS